MVLRKQNEILRRNDYLMAYCFKIVAAISGWISSSRSETAPSKCSTRKKNLKCCLCFLLAVYWGWISCSVREYQNGFNIKYQKGCKTPCKALAKIEYENRYQKNSKPTRFGGNIRSWFERVRQQFLQLRQSEITVTRREIFFLIQSYRCGYGTFFSHAPVLMLCGQVPDVLQFANSAESPLPQPFAGWGSCTGSKGALAQGKQWDCTAAGGGGRAGLIDSFHHVESYLLTVISAFSYYRAVIF